MITWAKVTMPDGRQHRAPFPSDDEAREWMAWLVSVAVDVQPPDSRTPYPENYQLELSQTEGVR